MRRVEGFDHRPGNHCGSTSLRNLARYYGWGYDEPTCFGLASGLGFTYFERPESPRRAFFGRPLWLETAFFEHLGIGHDHRTGQAWPALWDRVRSAIEAGDPPMLFTDIYHLDYYGTDTHFAPHSLLLVGYDDGEDGDGEGDEKRDTGGGAGTVLLADSEFEQPQRLPVACLRAALASEYVDPEPNRSLVVTDPEPGRAFADAARTAIAETARYTLDPADATRDCGPGQHGIPGIRAFAADLPTWTDLPDPSWAVRFAYQNVERRGTGGGCFRRLYADFLATAAEEAPEVPASAARRMESIADDWTAVGETLKDASERDPDAMDPLLDEAAGSIRDIADREAALFGELLDAVG